MNFKLQRVFTVEDTLTMECIEIIRQKYVILKDLDACETQKLDEVSLCILREFVDTLARPLEMFKKLFGEGLVPREWMRENVGPNFMRANRGNALDSTFLRRLVSKTL